MTPSKNLSAPPRFLPAFENQVGIVENEAYLSLCIGRILCTG